MTRFVLSEFPCQQMEEGVGFVWSIIFDYSQLRPVDVDSDYTSAFVYSVCVCSLSTLMEHAV